MATRKSVADDLHDENSAAYQRGMTELHKQLGPMADAYIQRIKQLAPEFAWVNVTFPFGELYTRDAVDLKTRELCTIAALTVQGSSLPQLKIHIDAALRTGATRAEVVEIITQMIAYCGFPAATNALMTAEAVFALHDDADEKPKPGHRTGAKK
jgi:4-carboxymuconolactone decarboxylase